MTAALVVAILTTINKGMDLFTLLLAKASPEDAEKLVKVIIEREAWWQENIWKPIGDFLSK